MIIKNKKSNVLKYFVYIKKNIKKYYKKYEWRFIYVWREFLFINNGLNSNNKSK